MNISQSLYQTNLSLLTDLYQLTMAQGYWKSGKAEDEATFNLFFRKNPFKGGFTVACGLSYVIDFLNQFGFTQEDIEYLATLKGNDDEKLFEKGFLDYLADLKFDCDVDAIPEGTLVFPHEPLVRIQGSVIQCQLIETPLLNIVNFQTLIATKAMRISLAAGDEPVLEFGLRRAQGIDGSLTASRAAYIGGCAASSNVLAGRLFGIPVKGTHAHSWIMSFDSEAEAFEAYAQAMPNNCVFLVDTYDTIEGVKEAIRAAQRLRKKGHEMIGIRLDSGDLAYLSIEARKLLDAAGFEKASIVASNDLDEYLINSLHQQGAKVNVWGIGTKLVTAFDQPALGGVYKISAIRKNKNEEWQYKVKLSEQSIKVSNPGIQQVRRFYEEDGYISDMIYDEEKPPQDEFILIDPMDLTKRKRVNTNTKYKDLLKQVFAKGELTYQNPSIHEIRDLAQSEIKHLHSSIKRFANPHVYPVGLEKGLFERKTELILKLRHF
jgi:nicotinate phosphoribosyltransferase